ncbi:MAG: type II toxin-antitoxin system HicA family toxin [Patescibacteria group bacterium]
MPKILPLKPREVLSILYKAGFIKWRQKGSHLSLYRKSDNRSLTIPIHFNKDMPKGTLRVIISQAGMTVDEFLSLKRKR